MHKANFMETICWQIRPFAVSNESRSWEETVDGRRVQMQQKLTGAMLPDDIDVDICQAGRSNRIFFRL